VFSLTTESLSNPWYPYSSVYGTAEGNVNSALSSLAMSMSHSASTSALAIIIMTCAPTLCSAIILERLVKLKNTTFGELGRKNN